MTTTTRPRTGARTPAFVRIALAMLLALALGSALAATDTRSLDLSGVRNVDASTVNGSVTVTIDPASTGVTVEHRGNVDYDVAVQGDTLRLQGRNRSLICINCEVSFAVRVPGLVALTLHTTNGNVTVTGAMERVEGSTTNGNVSTTDTGRAPLDLTTTNGRVELRDVTFPAGSDSRAQSTNGSVSVRGMDTTAALDITGHLSNGGIHVSLSGFSVDYPNTRSFRASSTGDGHASLTLETVNGSLTVQR